MTYTLQWKTPTQRPMQNFVEEMAQKNIGSKKWVNFLGTPKLQLGHTWRRYKKKNFLLLTDRSSD